MTCPDLPPTPHRGILRRLLGGGWAGLGALLVVAAPAGAASGNAVSALPAKKIVATGIRNTKAAPSFVIAGHLAFGGEKVLFRVADAENGDGSGTITVGGLEATFRKLGTTVYVLGSASFWRAAGGTAAAKAAAGRWVRGPASDRDLEVASDLLDRHNFFGSVQVTATSGMSLAKAGNAVVGGQPVVVVSGRASTAAVKAVARFSVATTGPAYLLSVSTSAGVGGSSVGVAVTFSHIGQPVHVAAPAQAISIDTVPITTTTTTTTATATTPPTAGS